MKRNGFGLLEVVVAVGIVILVVAAVVSLSQFVLRGYVTVGARTTAYQLAQQGVEVARAIRDTGTLDAKPNTYWDTGLPVNVNSYRANFRVSCGQSAVCPWELLSNRTEAITLDGINYTRSIFIENAGLSGSECDPNCSGAAGENANTRKIRVNVSWTEGTRAQSVEITTFLTNWRLET
jgi:Tfp pilus assembly protein PilV